MGAFREQLKLIPFVIAFFAIGAGFMFLPALTMAIIAAGFFLFALGCLIEDRRLALAGLRAEGMVVDHKVEENCFFPVIEFRDCDGRRRRETTRLGTGVREPAVGQSLKIIYDRTVGGGCEVDRFWRRSGFALALCAFGVIFSIGALLARNRG